MKDAIRVGALVTVIAFLCMCGVIWLVAQNLPDTSVPLHWNAAGEVDRWGTRREAIFHLSVVPLITVFTGAILAVAPSLDPRKANLEKSAKVYLITWVAVMIFMTAVHSGTAYLTLSGTSNAPAPSGEFVRLVIAGSAILIILIGNYMPKTRPNWFLGIRTPWTLSSDNAWERTHRMGGRLFIAAGFMALLSAFLFEGLALALVTPALITGAALTSVTYSYFAWRSADDKR